MSSQRYERVSYRLHVRLPGWRADAACFRDIMLNYMYP